MARIVEDSDEELPDLAHILKSSKSASCRKTTLISTSDSGHSAATEIVKRNSKSSGNSKRSNGIRDDPVRDAWGGKENQPEPPEGEMKRSKKRVLKRTSNNPLLQPIGSTDVRSGRALNSKGGRSRNLVEKKKADFISMADWEQESDFDQKSGGGSYGMSDFVVNDSESLEEEDSAIDTPPPRSARRLIRGRRPVKSVKEEHEGLELRMRKLCVEDSDLTKPLKAPPTNETKGPEESDFKSQHRKNTSRSASKSRRKFAERTDTSSDIDPDLDDLVTLRL
jgi:hypothetical protein